MGQYRQHMSVPSAPVEVRGEGVLLRAPRESDVDRLLEAFGDSGTQLWNPGPSDPDGVLAWIAERADWSAGTNTSWLITQPHDGDVLGSVSVWKIDLDQGDGEGNWQTVFIGIYVPKADDPRADEAAAARGE